MDGEREHDGQIHTLGLLEQLREDLRRYGHENGELYHRVDKALRELANPNLHDVELAHAFRIELWDRYGKDNLRMTIAATSSIVIAHAAFDVAITEYANERLIADKRAVSGMPGRLDRWRQSGPVIDAFVEKLDLSGLGFDGVAPRQQVDLPITPRSC